MRSSLAIFFALVVSFSFSARRAQATAILPTGLSQDCTNYIKSLPSEIEYDFVTVPEDWDHPKKSPKISIFYYGANLKKVLASGVQPIVYYNGGPGSPSHGVYEYFKAGVPAAQNIPFLFIDQRGTGCSGSYPVVPVTLQGAKRLALYGTRGIVRDSEAIRAKLQPHKPWKIFGQSFGGYVTHRYISMYPHALTKAFIHGSSLMTDGIAWAEDRMLSQKRVGDIYLQKYPGDDQILKAARALVPDTFCTGNKTSVQCGFGLLDYFGWSSLWYPGGWKRLHNNITQLLKPDQSLNLDFLNQTFSPGISTDDSMMDFMVAVIPGRELPGGLLNTWSCVLVEKRLKKAGYDTSSWAFSECRMSASAKSEFDSFLPKLIGQDYLGPDLVQAALDENPDLEFHLYSGELDTMVARESYEEEVQLLGDRVQYQNFLNIGHDWLNAPQIWVDMAN